jgi:F0F1-type ATP synthase assembly protein I
MCEDSKVNQHETTSSHSEKRTESQSNRTIISQVVAITATGLSIGWLSGLAASPVIASVIAVLLGLASGAVTIVRSQISSTFTSIATDARPISLLVIAVALGATGGVIVRTHGLLSPPHYSEEKTQKLVPTEDLIKASVLFMQIGDKECNELMTLQPNRIRIGFLSSSSEQIRKIGKRIENPEILKNVAEALCKE